MRWIVDFLPPVRISRLAQRVLQLQPYPPREVSFADAWSVYKPLVIYQAGGLFVVAVIVELLLPGRSRAPVAILLAGVLVLQLLFFAFVAGRVRSSLANGVEATAVVVRPASSRSTPRVEVNGHVTTIPLTMRRLRMADQVRVLTNPDGDKIWVSLN